MRVIQLIVALVIGLSLTAAEALPQQAGVFSVYGQVILHPEHGQPDPPDTVRVVNRATGVTLSSAVGSVEEGNYGVVFIDIVQNRAAAVGDTVIVELLDASGSLLIGMPPRIVTPWEIAEFGLVQSIPRFDHTVSFISGTVVAVGGVALEEMTVTATDVLTGSLFSTTSTDAVGFYAIGVDLGVYRVEVIPPAGSLWIGEYYNDLPSHDLANADLAETLLLGVPTLRADIDFALAGGGVFSGTVVDAQEGTPLLFPEIYPFVFGETALLRPVETRADGSYTSVALPAGSYGAAVVGIGGYLDEYYLEAAMMPAADPFSIALGVNTPAIDFTLDRDPVAVGTSPGTSPAFVLGAPQPNPFNAGTVLPFDVVAPADIRLSIYDVHGRLVRVVVDDHRSPGSHRVQWDGRDARGAPAAAGIYLVKLEGPGQTRTRRAVLLR